MFDVETFCAAHSGPDKAFSVSFEPEMATLHVLLKGDRPPTFARSAVHDFVALLSDLDSGLAQGAPIRMVVYRSPHRGIFSLGGDLRIIGPSLGQPLSEEMAQYGEACIDMVWRNWELVENHDVVTVALMTGDGLGGGFECALSCNHIALVSCAKVGFPEVTFGAFPGMGAIPFGQRRGGLRLVRKMVSTGITVPAAEAEQAGLVDTLVECGGADDAHAAMEAWFQPWRRQIFSAFSSHLVRLRCERKAFGVTRDELAYNVRSMVAGIAAADPQHGRLVAILAQKQTRKFLA
jgi:DSF synthase